MTFTVTNIGTKVGAGGGGGASTTVVTVGVGGVPAGANIYVGKVEVNSGGPGFFTGSCSDSKGNSYANKISVQDISQWSEGATFQARNVTALVNGDTITYSKGNPASYTAMSAFYVTGMVTASDPYDSATAATGTNQGGATVSGTPSVAGELFIAVTGFWDDANSSAGYSLDTSNGWAAPPTFVQDNTGGGDFQGVGGGTQVNSGTGTKTTHPTFSGPDTVRATQMIFGIKAGPTTISSSISGTGAVAASGMVIGQTSGSLSGTGTVSASGKVIGQTSGALTGTGTVSAGSSLLLQDTAGIVSTGTVSLDVVAQRLVGSSVSGTATVSASPSSIGRSPAAIAGSATVGVSEQVLRFARASITGTGSLSLPFFGIPASAANSLGEFTSDAVAVAYASGYVAASPLGAANPCLQNVVPSYLYEQYQDDDDLQAFVYAYNTITQEYVSWLNQYTLPVYTNPLITGDLLDWIARGLYGVERPSLSAGSNVIAGPYNSNALNQLTYNGRQTLRSAVYTLVSDDIFKRILTWKLYKGDGKVITVPWLKRRVYRFLFGPNGTDVNCGDLSNISVTFEDGSGITITVVSEETTSDSFQPLFNTFRFNEANFDVAKTLTKNTQSIQTYEHPGQVRITLLDNPPNAAIFQEAVEQGILDTPFQFTFVVSI